MDSLRKGGDDEGQVAVVGVGQCVGIWEFGW